MLRSRKTEGRPQTARGKIDNHNHVNDICGIFDKTKNNHLEFVM